MTVVLDDIMGLWSVIIMILTTISSIFIDILIYIAIIKIMYTHLCDICPHTKEATARGYDYGCSWLICWLCHASASMLNDPVVCPGINLTDALDSITQPDLIIFSPRLLYSKYLWYSYRMYAQLSSLAISNHFDGHLNWLKKQKWHVSSLDMDLSSY